MLRQALPALREGREPDPELLARRALIAELSGPATPKYVEFGGLRCAVATSAVPRARIVHCHGGGFRHGSARGWTAFASRLAAVADVEVLVPDYSLAPERPFPAAIHEIVSVLTAIQEGTSALPLILAGDSAGAGLALATASVLERPVPLAGIIFLSPWIDLRLDANSFRRCAASDATLSRETLAVSAEAYLQGVSPENPLASPLLGDLTGLPPVQVQVGSDEVLCDDSLALAERLAAAGVRCELYLEPGVPHVWPVPFPDLAASVRALARVGCFVSDVLDRSR